MIVTWLISVADADFGLTAPAPCRMSGQEGFMKNVSGIRLIRLMSILVRIFALIIFTIMVTLKLTAFTARPGALLSTYEFKRKVGRHVP